MAGRLELRDDLLGQPLQPHVGVLVGPHVEVRAVGLEHGALPGHHVGHGHPSEPLDAFRLRKGSHLAQARRIRGEPLRHELDEVLARIGVLRKLGGFAQRLS